MVTQLGVGLVTVCAGILPNLAQAQLTNECRRQLDSARRSGSRELVVTFEGLLGQELFGSPVKNQLLRPWMAENGAVPAIHHGCTTSMSASLASGCANQVKSAMDCVRAFRKALGTRLQLSVIGHSFGGSYGVFNFLRLAEQEGIFIENVMTLDPRTHHDDVATRGKKAPDPAMYRYAKPANVGRMINVYQCSGLRGYLVKNAMNISLCGKASHLGLPRHAEVRRLAGSLLGSRRSLVREEDDPTPITSREVRRPVREMPLWEGFQGSR